MVHVNYVEPLLAHIRHYYDTEHDDNRRIIIICIPILEVFLLRRFMMDTTDSGYLPE